MNIQLSDDEVHTFIKLLRAQKTVDNTKLIKRLEDEITRSNTVLFPTGIQDIDLLILHILDDQRLFGVCRVNKYSANLCDNQSFWRNRIINKFGVDIKEYKPKDYSYKQVYRLLANPANNKLYVAIDLGMLPLVEKWWKRREVVYNKQLEYLNKKSRSEVLEHLTAEYNEILQKRRLRKR